MNSAPIGIFDSGFGGLSITRAIIDLLPAENIVYVGDTARYPYGPRDALEVRSFAEQISNYLVKEHQVKLLVVACNTASATALDVLEKMFDIPVLGVIDAGIRAAISSTLNNRIGVIGTTGTIQSGVFQRKSVEIDSTKDVFAIACPGFTEFVERGETEGEQVTILAERLLRPLIDEDIDTLLLACTHYPFLSVPIAAAFQHRVNLVSASEETAFEVQRLLSDATLANAPDSKANHQFYSSGDVEWFKEMGRKLLGSEVGEVKGIEWD